MSARPPRPDLASARRAVLVQRPLHWEVAAGLIAALEAAWRELDARPAPTAPASAEPARNRGRPRLVRAR